MPSDKPIECPLPPEQLPRHVAIIMDGNGRWAQSQGLPRHEGHKAGIGTVDRIVQACCNWNIPYLTLFSFSTENWNREETEVSGLMKLLRQYLDSELDRMLREEVRLNAIGNLERLPFFVRSALNRNIEKTKQNSKLCLTLAISYGAREELITAAKQLAIAAKEGTLDPEDITEEKFSSSLWTHDMPDPDLLIRTSGELRISNFLLWQIAYSEIVITQKHWPEFSEACFADCLTQYASRERRFGLTSEQLQQKQGAS